MYGDTTTPWTALVDWVPQGRANSRVCDPSRTTQSLCRNLPSPHLGPRSLAPNLAFLLLNLACLSVLPCIASPPSSPTIISRLRITLPLAIMVPPVFRQSTLTRSLQLSFTTPTMMFVSIVAPTRTKKSTSSKTARLDTQTGLGCLVALVKITAVRRQLWARSVTIQGPSSVL